jgi:hypothetical protein
MGFRQIEPYRVCFQTFALLLGLAYAVVVPPPNSLAAVLPAWVVLVWAIGLTATGAAGLTANLAWRVDVLVRYAIERLALWTQVGVLGIIAGSAIYVNGARSAFTVAILATWATANVIRDRQIASTLHSLRKASRLIDGTRGE